MVERHYPGETLGIIGSEVSSALLAQAAGRLGFRVASLVLDQQNPVRQFASWQTVADTYDQAVLRFFAGRVDFVIVEAGLLSNQDMILLKSITDLALSEDLMAIATDRLIEKVYLDSHKFLVAPFSMVTNLEDIKEAVEYIGFPCYLKTTQRHVSGGREHIILYSEEDYPRAVDKLMNETCILEAWIPAEKKISLTAIRNERGDTVIYPPFELIQDSESPSRQVRFPANIALDLEREIIRLGEALSQVLGLVGSITIEFFLTSAGVIYMNSASVGLGDEAIFTMGAMSVDHFEATLRSIAGLPLPPLTLNSMAAIAYPVESLKIANVITQYMLRTDWRFILFNPMGNDPTDLIGYIVVLGDSIEYCQRQADITDILRK